MRLNLYVACCSVLAYVGSAIKLEDPTEELAQSFYQDEFLVDLAETYKDDKVKKEAAKLKAEIKSNNAAEKAAKASNAKKEAEEKAEAKAEAKKAEKEAEKKQAKKDEEKAE